MTKTPTPASHAVNTAPISADLRGMAGAGAQPDQDDFIQWLSGTYPDAYSADEARHLWRHEHVSALAWEAAKARYAAQPSRECLQQSDLHDAIMNLPSEASASQFLMKAERHAYRCGHRDARHAAAELAAARQSAPPPPAAVAVPAGFALVPKRLTRAMERVLSADEEGWQWEDLLAAAEAITEQEYAALAAAPAQAVAVPADLLQRVFASLTSLSMEASWTLSDTVTLDDVSDLLAGAPAQEYATQLAGQRRDLEVTDEMALSFHRAISDGAIGQDDVDDIKDGLRAAFCNIAAPAQAQEDARDAALPGWWPEFIQSVAELPDRNSPEDEPDAMVATADELGTCAINAIDAARAAQGGGDA